MKATMVEHRDEHEQWQWYKVSLSLTPRKAVVEYVREMDLAFSKDLFGRIPRISPKSPPDYEFADQVRAYQIDIEN